MRLNDCTQEELVILTAIVSLAAQLPGDLYKYTEPLGMLRKSFSKGKKLERRNRGFIESRTIRAS